MRINASTEIDTTYFCVNYDLISEPSFETPARYAHSLALTGAPTERVMVCRKSKIL